MEESHERHNSVYVLLIAMSLYSIYYFLTTNDLSIIMASIIVVGSFFVTKYICNNDRTIIAFATIQCSLIVGVIFYWIEREPWYYLWNFFGILILLMFAIEQLQHRK